MNGHVMKRSFGAESSRFRQMTLLVLPDMLERKHEGIDGGTCVTAGLQDCNPSLQLKLEKLDSCGLTYNVTNSRETITTG